MLPPLYAEDGNEYGASRYVAEERYAATADRGQERYGGGAAGGERYGIGVLLYKEVDDGYWTLLDADGPLDYMEKVTWDRDLPSDYAFQSLYGHTEFESDWEYT